MFVGGCIKDGRAHLIYIYKSKYTIFESSILFELRFFFFTHISHARTKSAGKCDRVQITSRTSSKILTSVGQNSLGQRLILPTSFSEYFILPHHLFTIGS